jgi:hypothetical protein
MNLSPQEQKMIAQLRKWQRDWRWGKWAVLVAGLVYFVFGSSICWDLHDDLTGANALTWIISITADLPFLFFFFCGGLFLILLSIWNWSGFASDTLLLKLVDEHPASNASKGVAGDV